jgi:SAM-dependent methyltransferase
MEQGSERFTGRAADYARYRPGYPRELLGFLIDRAAITPASVIADVGSGTGISSAFLIESGASVIGIEPNEQMRHHAEASLGPMSRFRSVAGSAERTELPASSVDLVTAFQAFHWFDPHAVRLEWHRILRHPGRVAIVRNEHLIDRDAFHRDLERLLNEFALDNTPSLRRNESAAVAFFDGLASVHRFAHSQKLDAESLCGRVRSNSYLPAEGHPRFAAMMSRLDAIFAKHQQAGVVRLDYEAVVVVGTLD